MVTRRPNILNQFNKFFGVNYFSCLFLLRTVATPTSTIKIVSIRKNVPSSLTAPFGRIKRIIAKNNGIITTNRSRRKYLAFYINKNVTA
jgi:hypothetical protein